MAKKIYFDGSSRKNLFVVTDHRGRILSEGSVDVPATKSQRAEYKSLIAALRVIDTYKSVVLVGDCQNVILQMQGINRVRDSHLRKLYLEAQELINTRGLNVSFEHVLRDDNLAGLVLDGR